MINPGPKISKELYNTPSDVPLPYTLLADPGVNSNQRDINPAFDVLTADGRTVHTSNDWDERNTPGRPFGSSTNPADWTSKADYSKNLDKKTQDLVFPQLFPAELSAPANMHYSQDNGQPLGTKGEDGKDIDAAPDTSRGAVIARFVLENLRNSGRDTSRIDEGKLAASIEGQGVDLRKSKAKAIKSFGKAVEKSGQGAHQLFQNRTLGSHNRKMGSPVKDSIVPVAVQQTGQLFSGGWWSEHKRLKGVWAEYDRKTAATELKYLRKTDAHTDKSHQLSYFHKDRRQARIRNTYIRTLEHHEHHGEAKTHNLAYGGFDIPLMPNIIASRATFIPEQYKALRIDTGAARKLERLAMHLASMQTDNNDEEANKSGAATRNSQRPHSRRPGRDKRHPKSTVKTKRVAFKKPHHAAH